MYLEGWVGLRQSKITKEIRKNLWHPESGHGKTNAWNESPFIRKARRLRRALRRLIGGAVS